MRKYRFLIAALAMVPLAAIAVPASEVPGVTPLEFAVEEFARAAADPAAHWIWSVLAWEAVGTIAGWIFLALWDRVKNTRYATAVAALRNAVAATYQEYVRAVKAANAGGKLTEAQKNEALQHAYRRAVDFAKSDGVDLAKVLAKDVALAVIERFVGESKAGAVVVPLPDLPA